MLWDNIYIIYYKRKTDRNKKIKHSKIEIIKTKW